MNHVMSDDSDPLSRHAYITVKVGDGRTVDLWKALRHVRDSADNPAEIRSFVHNLSWLLLGAMSGRGGHIAEIAAFAEAGGINAENAEAFDKALYSFFYRGHGTDV